MHAEPVPWTTSIRRAHYAPASAIDRHHHADALLCLVVGGRYEESTRGRVTLHAPGHALFCPAHEEHAQRFSDAGAQKILIAPSTAALEFLQAHLQLGAAPFAQAPQFLDLGLRMAAELGRADAFSGFVAEGLALEALGVFA